MGIYTKSYLLFGYPADSAYARIIPAWKCGKQHFILEQHGLPVILNTSPDHDEIRKGYVEMEELLSFMNMKEIEMPHKHLNTSEKAQWYLVEAMTTTYDPSDLSEHYIRHLPVK